MFNELCGYYFRLCGVAVLRTSTPGARGETASSGWLRPRTPPSLRAWDRKVMLGKIECQKEFERRRNESDAQACRYLN